MGCFVITSSLIRPSKLRRAMEAGTKYPCSGLAVASRCGSLLLSLSVDMRSADDVIAFEGSAATFDHTLYDS